MKLILFDLDGTISDPKIGITRAVQYSLRFFGIESDLDTLVKFIGPPLRDSYRMFYGFDAGDTEIAVAQYREYFAKTGIYENTLYDGIIPMLEALTKAGKQLAIATSKPTMYAEKILRYFDINKYYTFVAGSEMDGRRSKKAEVIRYALENLGQPNLDDIVMVGDREHDVIGAREVGVQSIGVLYGYGNMQELTAAGAGCICESVDDLRNLLCV